MIAKTSRSSRNLPRSRQDSMWKQERAVLLILVVAGIATVYFFISAPHSSTSGEGNNTIRSSNTIKMPPWKLGMLDLHHLRVGASESSFYVFPDGTTVLVDAGEVNFKSKEAEWEAKGWNLKVSRPFPDNSRTPAGWILDYVRANWPRLPDNNSKNTTPEEIDYVLLTHFHTDHYGQHNSRDKDSNRPYVLTGLPEVGNGIRFGKLIDRGYPDYDFPKGLRKLNDPNINNYLRFVDNLVQESHTVVEKFDVGSTGQIRMLREENLGDFMDKHHFQVKVIRSGLDVAKDGGISPTVILGEVVDKDGDWDENEMSGALVLEYGNFRYYEGGDQEVTRNPIDGSVVLDTVTPTAQAAGQVDVATLNHHGHGVTDGFITYMDPPVLILQAWCSDQPPKSSMEILSKRLRHSQASAGGTRSSRQREIFATDILDERLEALGPLAGMFTSVRGHVVVRVHAPPTSNEKKDQIFEIYVLDGDRNVQSHHGPYIVRKKER